jgi:hypothetical protein
MSGSSPDVGIVKIETMHQRAVHQGRVLGANTGAPTAVHRPPCPVSGQPSGQRCERIMSAVSNTGVSK